MDELEEMRILLLELQEKVLMLEDKVAGLEATNMTDIPIKLDALGG